MKHSEILREAARLILTPDELTSGETIYAATRQAAGGMIEEELMGRLHEIDDPSCRFYFQGHEHRSTALCLAAAIAESEGK